MKKPSINFLLAVTCLFVGITIGFSLGRNANRQTVRLSALPAAAPETTAASVISREPPVSGDTTVSGTATTPLEINSHCEGKSHNR